MFMVHLGQTIEKSPLWPEVKDYFHMVNWILTYKPGEAAPHNCESFFILFSISVFFVCVVAN